MAKTKKVEQTPPVAGQAGLAADATRKNVSVDASQDEVKVVAAESVEVTEKAAEEKAAAATSEAPKAKKVAKVNPRSKKYRDMRALVDRSKFYPVTEAIELVKKTSYSGFVGTMSADLVLKEVENQIKVSFPYTTGKSLRVAIVDEGLLEQIEAGKIDFDVLLTAPQFMPKLAKLARILGPKGLMPNPKNGTIANDPEKAKKELLGGKTILKTERKAPLLHVALGKADMATSDLQENLEALLKVVDGKVLKVVLSSSMSPGVKVQI